MPAPAGSGAPGRRLNTENPADVLVIGLVNNMPDGALRSTERQFRALLAAAASDNYPICLQFFFLPGVPRGEAARAHLTEWYQDTTNLGANRLDGLIVTGMEPRAPVLSDEPYWQSLTKLLDWAEGHAVSTIWSCLAAHAAVLHRDGIMRRALPRKLVGVFDCRKTAGHAIVDGAPARWRVPHSRYNEVPEADLVANGYQVLSRSRPAGVDLFIKEDNSLQVFFQGHPEYDAAALSREYRRDIQRFLAGEKYDYPGMPRGYFGKEATVALVRLRRQALRDRGIDLSSCYPAIGQDQAAAASAGPGVSLYANWLSYLARRKSASRVAATGSPAAHR